MFCSTRHLFSLAALLRCTLGQITSASPLATQCHPNNSTVICIEKYAHKLPEPFGRIISRNGSLHRDDSFKNIIVPSDSSLNLAANASFLVFNPRGLEILRPSPVLRMATYVPHSLEGGAPVLEAPVYIPSTDIMIYSMFSFYQPGQQLQSNVTHCRSTSTCNFFLNFSPEPPVLGVNGGVLHNGLLYWATSGSKPGIIAVNVTTKEATSVLNNYFGNDFNTPNDLVFDSTGDLFFTDGFYGWQKGLPDQSPALQTATYRFRPSTGAVSIVEVSLVQPNGIAFSPDQKTLYIGDRGAVSSNPFSPSDELIPPMVYNVTDQRVVYAFDVVTNPDGKYLINKRPIWLTQEYIPDGIKVARTGEVLVAAGAGVDVLNPYGILLLRIVAPFHITIVNSIQFAGEDYKQLWMFGQGGVAVVEWELQGMEVK